MVQDIRDNKGIIKDVYTIVDWNLPQSSGKPPSKLMESFELNYNYLVKAQDLI